MKRLRMLLRAWALLVAALLPAACARAPSADAWAVDLAARQQEADRFLDAGDASAARAALTAVIAEARRSASADDGRLIQQDTYYRLARLALAERDPAAAMAAADAGLALGAAPHLFVANLLVVKGAAHEAAGDPRAAAADYHQALVMNETLLKQALPSP